MPDFKQTEQINEMARDKMFGLLKKMQEQAAQMNLAQGGIRIVEDHIGTLPSLLIYPSGNEDKPGLIRYSLKSEFIPAGHPDYEQYKNEMGHE